MTATSRRNRPDRFLVLCVAAAFVGTLFLYQPWRALPFEIVDFSEFIPFLRLPTLAERLHGFLHYYGALGRWNVLSYLVLIAKWTVFGAHAAW